MVDHVSMVHVSGFRSRSPRERVAGHLLSSIRTANYIIKEFENDPQSYEDKYKVREDPDSNSPK